MCFSSQLHGRKGTAAGAQVVVVLKMVPSHLRLTTTLARLPHPCITSPAPRPDAPQLPEKSDPRLRRSVQTYVPWGIDSTFNPQHKAFF